MVSPFLGLVRFAAFTAWTLLLVPPYLLTRMVSCRRAGQIVLFYWRGVIRLIGFTVVARGAPEAGAGPALYVANHASYLDIIVLGSLIPACFIAKAEVAGWPGFGLLARLARTVFVDRRPTATARERDSVRHRLENGDSLILFAEGTSSDGNRVLAFKSALLSVAETGLTGADGIVRPLPVQPVSLAYTRLDGLPLTRAMRPFLAWYGDMTLAGHLLGALGLGRVTVEVTFHPATSLASFPSRKDLTVHCHDLVANGVATMLAGRAA
ncbi:lysophospholipid acyltransferase family protein [Magnetospirillum fulvum]|uniref:Lyso-ornithine lipid acyltransferase n=1 Tax=Magnetospirillum fulvum TaxID=1082 RepID=A0A1H6GVC8_MAGFU|nr:lysophospholipid acyltransferase family protein [Magnetospirillum fulvum]SEH27437.1 lyso-ornithine lipid acyltransferase [Magnetospirillum fulvum]